MKTDNKRKNDYYTISNLIIIMKEFENMIRDAFIINKEDKHSQTKGE